MRNKSGLALALASLFLCASGHAAEVPTRTPIKHLVVIFQENVSFDHYFGSYPLAGNPPGEPAFTALPGTPAVNGLSQQLLTHNPNASNPANGEGASNPFRLDRSQAATADQQHGYAAEQRAFNDRLMDLFPHHTGTASPGGAGAFGTPGQVMGYYDGNTVTALWNYAQHYAMSDNFFGTTFGPSTPGAINLISGQTNGAVSSSSPAADGSVHGYQDRNGVPDATLVPDGQGGLTVIGDDDPTGDVCSNPKYPDFALRGKNIGDLLNARHISWGFFSGGFELQPTATDPSGCHVAHRSAITGVARPDYIPHHQPFQYYPSTANPQHRRPASVAVIGSSADGGANHQYDLKDFYAVLQGGHLPAVSYVKAPAYQDGHAGYSDPLDEQTFIVQVVNAVQASPDWKDTAIIITYDDSDGWYDHASAIVNGSSIPAAGFDSLVACTSAKAPRLKGVDGKPVQGRCGHGPRLPLLLVSPYARQNHVDHHLTDQTSVLRFIEDNWLGGQRIGGSFDAHAGSLEPLFDFRTQPRLQAYRLDESTGEPLN
jgi:phospholipase C